MNMSNEVPPVIQAPTAKERKYDRQLRLWAASGQRALEESHVLLIIPDTETGSSSSVAGSETLKNLILPSIGQFTILDPAKVTEADLGINFFLEAESLGKSRADEARRLLEELNPDVQGHSILETVDQFLEDPSRLKIFNLVLLCGPAPSHIISRLSLCLWTNKTPLIYIQSRGFYSTFSIQLPSDFPVVDTHPDPESTQDLRLLVPWEELRSELSKLGNIDQISDDDHGHIPYVLLLLHYLDTWKLSHEGRGPENFKEKIQFRDIVRQGARTGNAEGGEENYDEAVAAVLKTINLPTIGSSVRELFQNERCQSLAGDSSDFWFIAAAVRRFYDLHGVLPLPGSLPDMKARSAQYIQLQNIYKAKARADAKEVLSTVRDLEQEVGKAQAIAEAEIDAFCKNAAHVKVIAGERLPLVENKPETTKAILSNLDNEESLIPIFLASAVESSSNGNADDAVTEFLERILKANGKGGIIDSASRQRVVDACKELGRAAGGELHNISSLTGGMVAQEAIKIITKQYVPVHNTCIFDGIRSRTETLTL